MLTCVQNHIMHMELVISKCYSPYSFHQISANLYDVNRYVREYWLLLFFVIGNL